MKERGPYDLPPEISWVRTHTSRCYPALSILHTSAHQSGHLSATIMLMRGHRLRANDLTRPCLLAF